MTLLSVVQMNSQNDIEANFSVIESLMMESKAQGASLIVFPENFVCFAAGKQRETAERFDEFQTRLQDLAHQYQLYRCRHSPLPLSSRWFCDSRWSCSYS